MKQIIFCLVVAIASSGCEPGHRIYLQNNSMSKIFVRTHPSIESLYDPHSSYLDSVRSYKVKEDGEYSIYAIKPGAAILMWGDIGGPPNAKTAPFDNIAIIRGTDTTILNSKEQIISKLKRGKKKGDYYLEIDEQQ